MMCGVDSCYPNDHQDKKLFLTKIFYNHTHFPLHFMNVFTDYSVYHIPLGFIFIFFSHCSVTIYTVRLKDLKCQFILCFRILDSQSLIIQRLLPHNLPKE